MRRILVGLLSAWCVLAGVAARAAEAAGAARAARAARADDVWQPVGLGGSGGMFCLAVSPLDPRQMMINCDMSGAYLSRDGGRTWRMIHHGMLGGNTQCPPAYHPTRPGRIYAAGGWEGQLRVSDDGGITWRPVAKTPWKQSLKRICLAPDFPKLVLVGAGRDAYLSEDDGATWRRCEGVGGEMIGACFTPAACFIATAEGVFRSKKTGEGYTRCGKGLPKGELTSFSGGGSGEALRLYATTPTRLVDGELTGGVYVSIDGGDAWKRCAGGLNEQTHRTDQWANGDLPQYRFIATTSRDPNRVYVHCAGTSYWPPNHATVYRSDDGGATWRAVLFSDPRFAQRKLYNVEDDYVARQWKQREQAVPYSMVVCDGDPDVVALCSSAWCLRTDEGGGSWRVCHTGPAVDGDHGGQAWRCNGLVVTTTWNYYIDPHVSARHYIAYTDIGFARSLDAGKTWIWQALSLPWKNTVYELALDPAVPGRMWAAGSNTHDIPNDNVISGRHRVTMQGGVAQSDDFGVTWRALGLPAAPCLSVLVDPASPSERRTLYASLFEKGVYKSTDGGRTWASASRGLGHPSNMRCCKLARASDGSLAVLITGKRTASGRLTSEGVGLYRSTDGGDSWTKINASLPLHWPKDFTIKPDDPQTILLSAAGSRTAPDEGGLYRTGDGGRSWTRLAQKGREHFGAFYHPNRPGWIYMTLTEGAPESGLYLSRDDGATWEPFASLPFVNIQRVTFDPSQPGRIILSTFGSSIFRGPEEP